RTATGAERSGRARRVRERDIAETNLARRCPARGAIAGSEAAGGTHRRLQSEHRGDGRGRSVERPTESAECDHRHADGALYVDDDFPETDAAMGGGARQ